MIQEHLRLFELDAHQAGLSYYQALRIVCRQLLVAELERHAWNQCKAAPVLRMHRNTLNRLMAELEITRPVETRMQGRKPSTRELAPKVERMIRLALGRFRRA